MSLPGCGRKPSRAGIPFRSAMQWSATSRSDGSQRLARRRRGSWILRHADTVPASIRALVASMMGEQDRAMELVEEACDERDPVLLFMARAFPGFERVRDDPRFADIARRLQLP